MSKKDVVPAGSNGGAIVAPVSEDTLSRLAKYAKQTQVQEVTAGQFFSTRSGILSLGGQPCPGNSMVCVILRSMHENVLYPEAFSGDNITPPTCFAFSDTGVDMRPHDNSAEKQNDTCEGCPQMEWKKPPNGGNPRKTCKETRRLSCMTEGSVVNAEAVRNGQSAYLRVPVTSVKLWSAYAQRLASGNLPPFAVLTRVTVKPDPKTQFRIEFELIRVIEDDDVLKALEARYVAEETRMAFPYQKKVVAVVPIPPPTDTPPQAAPAGKF